jgi:hypothetical protein
LNQFVTSIIRTVVPMAVGRLAAWALLAGLTLPGAAWESLEASLTVGLAAAYYAAVRALEARWPAAGWLLGVDRQPEYSGMGLTAEEVADALDAARAEAPRHRADG